MNRLCLCNCGSKLRKDNKTGYAKGHKPCPICGTLVIGSSVECCSKSCSAQWHWKNHPEMKESRCFNSERFATRNKNKEAWVENLSAACMGRVPWNKDKKGLQVAWNKDLPKEQQPFFGKTHTSRTISKREETNLKNHGVRNSGFMAKNSPRSKKEKLVGKHLPKSYKINQTILGFRPDYIDLEKKHIIEIYGDYWHCNPKLYDKDFYHSRLKMTALEKWNKDQLRKSIFESAGYTVTIVWERDIEKFIQGLK